MHTCNFELIALVRPFLISLGAGLVVGAMGYFLMRERNDWQRRKPVLIMALVGLVLLSTAAIPAFLPTLVTVPPLGGLSREEAEDKLVRKSLLSDPKPQYANGVEAGRVIAGSQTPGAGLAVRCRTVISFAVAVAGQPPQASDSSKSSSGLPTVELFEPRVGAPARSTRHSDGVGSVSASGVSHGIQGGRFQLLLWVRPVRPPSDVPGWYLQRPPANGITEINADGSWRGVAQIGNAHWPPQEGHMVDLAVSVADSETASRLMAEGGVVVRPEPIGIAGARATGVVLTFK